MLACSKSTSQTKILTPCHSHYLALPPSQCAASTEYFHLRGWVEVIAQASLASSCLVWGCYHDVFWSIVWRHVWQMYVTAKCTCLVLVRKKTQKQTHVHHCDCTARSNDSKWKKRPPRANGCSLWIQNQNWHSHPISTFLCTVFVQEKSLNGFPKSWRLKSISSRIMQKDLAA